MKEFRTNLCVRVSKIVTYPPKKTTAKNSSKPFSELNSLKKELKQEKEKNQILKTKIKDLEDKNAKLKVERDYEEMVDNESNKNKSKSTNNNFVKIQIKKKENDGKRKTKSTEIS